MTQGKYAFNRERPKVGRSKKSRKPKNPITHVRTIKEVLEEHPDASDDPRSKICRWPIWHEHEGTRAPAYGLFCGKCIDEDKNGPYCDEHESLAINKELKKKLDAEYEERQAKMKGGHARRAPHV